MNSQQEPANLVISTQPLPHEYDRLSSHQSQPPMYARDEEPGDKSLDLSATQKTNLHLASNYKDDYRDDGQ